MARKPTTPKAADPLDMLATGIAADHKVKMANDAKSAADFAEDPKPSDATDPATASVGEIVDNDPLGIGQDDEPAREQVRVESEKPTKLPTPAAPGDEPDTVFQRRLQRLTTLAIEAEFETGTAFGNLRDCVLDMFKHRPMLWDAMKPSDRRDLIAHVEGICRDIIGKVVLVIAQGDEDAIQGTLDKKWGVNGETIEMKVKIDNADGETLVDALKLAGHKIMIVSADSKRFMSAPRNIDPGDDQVSMAFVDDKPVEQLKPSEPEKKPEPEVSDEQLADGDNTESGVDRAKDAAAEPWDAGKVKSADPITPPADKDEDPDPVDKPFGVFDTADGEWLVSLGVGEASDVWTADTGEALAMTGREAENLASEYGDGFEARRFDDEG